MFFFVPLCFVATSIIKSNEDLTPLSRIMGDYKFLKKLLWNEFIFDELFVFILEQEERS